MIPVYCEGRWVANCSVRTPAPMLTLAALTSTARESYYDEEIAPSPAELVDLSRNGECYVLLDPARLPILLRCEAIYPTWTVGHPLESCFDAEQLLREQRERMSPALYRQEYEASFDPQSPDWRPPQSREVWHDWPHSPPLSFPGTHPDPPCTVSREGIDADATDDPILDGPRIPTPSRASLIERMDRAHAEMRRDYRPSWAEPIDD